MKERISTLQKNMPEDVNAILLTSPINRLYFTGFPSSAGTVLLTPRKSYFIIDGRYHEAASAAVKSCEVILQDKLYTQLGTLLKQHKVKTLGIESQNVTVSQFAAWENAFSGVTILRDERVSTLMSKIRGIKSKEEMASIRAAQQIADKAFLHILNYIEAGRTENEIAIEMEIFCRQQGAEGQSFGTIVASGPNGSMPHAMPSERKIQTGDLITMDFGCMVDGYCSDMTRTVAVGSVSDRQRECYETVLCAQVSCLEKIRAGVLCKDIDKIARDIIDASEFKGCFTHSLGHSLGLEVHEAPRCTKDAEESLEAGMMMTVEPGIYVPGEFGVRIEDFVAVTDTGCENFCTSPKELLIL